MDVQTAKVKKPAAREIDRQIAEYARALAKVARAVVLAKGRGAAAELLKVELTALVLKFGGKHAQKSLRLAGDHNTATATIGTSTFEDAEAVEKLRVWLVKLELEELLELMFIKHVSYQLVAPPDEVLKTLTLTKTVREGLRKRLKSCMKTEPKKPSLKVEVIEPQIAA